MKKEMILITKDYPFGDGDNVFVQPEINSLCEQFRLSVISTSNSEEIKTNLIENVNYLHYYQKLSIMKKFKYFFNFWFDKCASKEILEIIQAKKNILRRIWKSIEFYACAEEFYKFFNSNFELDKFDGIIYTFWCDEYTFSIIRHKKEEHKYKLISRLHGRDLYNERYTYGRQPFRFFINRGLDHLFFAAELPRKYYLELYKDINIEKTNVIRLGAYRADKINISKANCNENIIVSCSNLVPIKRVELIIEGLAEIKDININWVHFGGGTQYNVIKALAYKKLGKKDNILFDIKGKVNNKEILEYYREHTIEAFITVSASEGCPVSVMEAMAYGIPVIGTSVGDIPYMISNNGVLLSENPSALKVAEAIRTVMNLTPSEKRKMRLASYNLWAEKFDIEKNVTEFIYELQRL